MKKYFLIPLLLFSLVSLSGFSRSFERPISLAQVSVDAEEMIKDIIAVVGLKPNFDVKAANIPNAVAITYNGKRYIAYNPTFIANLNAKAGNKWASVSILAHEVGHHLNGHTLLPTGSQPALELEADEFSGFVLHKMGASLNQAQAAMKIGADYKPSLTHPGQVDRLSAIARGWNRAYANPGDMAKYNRNDPMVDKVATGVAGMSQSNAPRESIQAPVAPATTIKLDSRFILARVNFPSDRATYFITRQFTLVKVVASELVKVGKLMPTNDPLFPFVMKNERGTLFVDRAGKIFTPYNELAGYLTMG